MPRKLLIVIALLFGSAGVAQAELLVGVKTGSMSVSFDDAKTSSDPVNLGLMLGYELGILAGDLAIEAEITRTSSAGSVNGQDLEVETNGIYLAYTTPGPFYFKARGGLMSASLDAGDLSEDESGETYGLGVGFSLGLFRIEVEYTAIDDDVDFVSVGLVY